ncbi:MAG: sterol desaturase family protein [Bacteroidales bacterium]|nr:sterol desaturase family protein [Bacteroidales bacterium]MDT8374237.1 sterol desaturase family protein [Bacteroidales bacterium]
MNTEAVLQIFSERLAEFFSLSWNNYFWWLTGLSLFFWVLEIIVPWRKDQSLFRKDFWLDAFYMYFNMFILPMIALSFVSALVNDWFLTVLANVGVSRLDIINLSSLPATIQLIILFLFRDFIQYNIHRLLHRIPWMWEFHKVHHSVKQMGFAAHLRYHWVEGVFYGILQYIPLAILGFSVSDFMIVYVFSLAVGHSNHSNYYLPLGKLKYLFNNPQMHIWHHVRELPGKYGVNFGMTLSVWDYIFRTAYVPADGKDKALGFSGDDHFPKKFTGQFLYPFYKNPAKMSG